MVHGIMHKINRICHKSAHETVTQLKRKKRLKHERASTSERREGEEETELMRSNETTQRWIINILINIFKEYLHTILTISASLHHERERRECEWVSLNDSFAQFNVLLTIHQNSEQQSRVRDDRDGSWLHVCVVAVLNVHTQRLNLAT